MDRRKRIATIAALLLAAAATLVWQTPSSSRPTAKPTVKAARERDLEVFRAVFDPWVHSGSRIVIQMETVRLAERGSFVDRTQYAAADMAKGTKGLGEKGAAALVKELLRRSSVPAKVPQIGTKERIILVREKELDKLFEKYWWDGFYRRYPKSEGLVRLSRPAFSKDGRWAVIYQSWQRGGRSGVGNLQLFQKVDGKWKKVHSTGLWIS